MKILDLFCGAGGASMGIHQAYPEAEIVGVDIKPQKRYPFKMVVADALEVDINGYDFIWASPPCQAFSIMRRGRWQDRAHPELIEPIRKRLIESGTHYCIENVVGAPLINPVMLCGTMFGLGTRAGNQLRRHRLFEVSFPIDCQLKCNHNDGSAIGVYGGGQHPSRRRLPAIGVYGNSGGSSKRDGVTFFSTQDRRYAMGIQWMAGKELSESIPPAYSKYIMNEYKSFKINQG